MTDARPHWLIVSASARALAHACVSAGWTCDVIDPFSDTDTMALARRSVRAAFDDGCFADDLPQRIADLGGRWRGIIAGSGFERSPGLLASLSHAAAAPLIGNNAATVRRCKDADLLGRALAAAGVAFAPARSSGAAPANWLMKRTGGCGGTHVRPARHDEPIPPGWHAQQRIPGIPASVLFLADGRRARIVGVSRQKPGSAAGPYAWREAVGDLPLAGAPRMALERDVGAMVRALGLRGLNGADLVFGRKGHVVLEINPRPTATLALYGDRVPGGLFAAHVAADAGRLDSIRILPAGAVRGLRVVYAPRDLYVGSAPRWPDGCSDLPASGTHVPHAAPVCTVHASGVDAREVHARLLRREHEVLNLPALHAVHAAAPTRP